MLTRRIITNAQTGEVTEEEVELPDEPEIAATYAIVSANAATLDSKLDQALAANDAFLAIASPTQAQTLAQLRLVTRENSALIRKLRAKLDSVAGT